VSNTEIEWLAQARKGDDQAFACLVEIYQKPVFNLCYRMLGTSGEAEEAAQESFIRAYQGLAKYDNQRPVKTWLLSIAAHYCIDQLRRRKMVTFSLDADDTYFEAPDPSPDPEAVLYANEEQRMLHALIKTLGPQDRATIIMRYWYDLSDEEIGQALSLSVSAVKSRLHRSRRELAELWLKQQTNSINSERRCHASPTV